MMLSLAGATAESSCFADPAPLWLVPFNAVSITPPLQMVQTFNCGAQVRSCADNAFQAVFSFLA